MASRNTQHTSAPATGRVREPSYNQSVERAVALLRAVAAASGSDGTATALAQSAGLNRTTTWRILATLEHEGLVSLDRGAGTYSLGFGLIDLAGRASGVSLARAARGVLERIAGRTGETAALAVMREGALTYVSEAVAGALVSVTWRGRPVSLHATSTGKVLLAFSEPEEVQDLLHLPRGGRLQRFTAATIISRAALKEELERTRERGYSICQGEFEESAWGVSAPVLVGDRPVAVVSIWGPPERITADRFESLGDLAMAGAEELADRISPASA